MAINRLVSQIVALTSPSNTTIRAPLLFNGARVIVPLKAALLPRSTLHSRSIRTSRPHPESAGVGHGTSYRPPGCGGLEALGKIITLNELTFEEFGFADPLARALVQCGYAKPTPIQAQALPPQLTGRDLLGLAETGSGKTAAFVLPILQRIAANQSEPGFKQVLTLVLAPTRELAIQIDQEIASLARNMNIKRAVVLGGVSKGPQISALKRGVHILVATPGRLLDHVNMRSCDLSTVETLVIDEADRMFDMGFVRDIRKIVSLIPMKRRTALFSATMPTEISKLANEVLNNPQLVELRPKTVVVDRINQKVMMVRTSDKQRKLHDILGDPDCARVIVFTRTKRGADRVADRLGMAGISASAFHGNKAQNARQRALNDFSLGHTRVLVATDIAARGIDVSNVTHVVNFDMPTDPETYVHRVGRTARKGTNGIAISLCDPSERPEIQAIERLTKTKLEVIGDALPDAPAAENGEARPAANQQRSRPQQPQRHHSSANGPRKADGQRDRQQQGNRRHKPHARNGERDHGAANANGAKPADRNQRTHQQPREERAAFDPMQSRGNQQSDRKPANGHQRREDRPDGRGWEPPKFLKPGRGDNRQPARQGRASGR